MIRSALTVSLLASAVAAQTATVNDAVSPGTLGDSVLSLDEAVRVVNGTLPLASLSAAERAQISGTGTPTFIEIDGAATPTITLNADVTPLDGPAAGVTVSIRGVNGVPTLDATGRTWALRVRTNHADISDLTITNGTDGILFDSSVNFTPGRNLVAERIDFSGQTGAAVHAQTSATGPLARGMIKLCNFENLNFGIELDDLSTVAVAQTHVEQCKFANVRQVFDMFSDGTGAMTLCRMWRCKGDVERIGFVRRGATASKRNMIMLVASEFNTTEDAMDAVGTPQIETAVHIHHSTVRPAAGKKSFILGPRDARIDFHISENTIYGDIDCQEGTLNRRLWAWNNIFRDGDFNMDNQGAPPSFRWNRFENCTIRALPPSLSVQKHLSSEFYNCRFESQSFVAPIELENCYVSNSTFSGTVNQVTPAPSPWLADTGVSDDEPSLGDWVTLSLDLPPGMLGVWELGVSDPRLVLTQEPWRDYAFNPGVTLLIPGFYALRSTLSFQVPVNSGLVGQQIYCKSVTGPVAGQAHVPVFNLPRGAHLTIQP